MSLIHYKNRPTDKANRLGSKQLLGSDNSDSLGSAPSSSTDGYSIVGSGACVLDQIEIWAGEWYDSGGNVETSASSATSSIWFLYDTTWVCGGTYYLGNVAELKAQLAAGSANTAGIVTMPIPRGASRVAVQLESITTADNLDIRVFASGGIPR